MMKRTGCLLVLISCKVQQETGKEANVRRSRDLFGSRLRYCVSFYCYKFSVMHALLSAEQV